jgi:hypothetical protein
MSYDLKKREIIKTDGQTVYEFFYCGSVLGDFTDLDKIDAENMRLLMKYTMKQEQLSEFNEAQKLTGLTMLAQKGAKLRAFYHEMFDVVMKYMNHYLWMTEPKRNAKDVDTRCYKVDGGIDSPKLFSIAYDKCVEPISNALIGIINECVNDLFPKAITNLATSQALNNVVDKTKEITAQLQVVETKKNKKKQQPG